MVRALKEKLYEYTKYLKYIKPYIKYEVMILILVMLSSVIALANPVLLQIIIDRVLVLKEVYLLKYIIIAMVVFYIINMMIIFSNGFLGNYIGQMVSIKLRKDLVNHIQKLKLKEIIESSAGDFITKISDDVGTISGFLTGTFISTLANSFNLLATAGLMMFFSLKLSIIAIIITVIQVYISIKFAKITRENQKELREMASVHLSFLKQILTGVKYVKAYQAEKNNERKYLSILQKIQKLTFKNFYINFNYGTCLSLTSFLGSVLIFSFGVNEILKGNMTVGALFVFDMVSERFYQFAGEIVNLNISLQKIIVAFDRINTIFFLKTENYEQGDKIITGSTIRFQDVSFQYNTGEGNKVLDNISLELKSGETYALVGASGGGKSTLLNLIMRFYESKSGEVYIGDSKLSEVSLKSLRKKISLVFQDAMINDESIEENIRFGNRAVSFDEIKRVSRICCIDEYIESLSDKYDTKVGEDGDMLSGGQKQRISIARGILRNSDIYIFDEALSNLDKTIEQKIFNNIQEKLTEKTKIYITHNINLIKGLKNIIVLNDGKIEDVGDHEKLIKTSRTYKEFFEKGEQCNEENQHA